VISQVAVPVESVSAVHVSEPFRVKVIGSFAIGALVLGLVRTADTGVGVEKSPVTGATVRVDGDAVVDCDGVATSFWSRTDSPYRVPD
jgi:hypothetical protein